MAREYDVTGRKFTLVLLSVLGALFLPYFLLGSTSALVQHERRIKIGEQDAFGSTFLQLDFEVVFEDDGDLASSRIIGAATFSWQWNWQVDSYSYSNETSSYSNNPAWKIVARVDCSQYVYWPYYSFVSKGYYQKTWYYYRPSGSLETHSITQDGRLPHWTDSGRLVDAEMARPLW